MPSENGRGAKRERIALYLRVSSEEQRDRETIEIQRAFLAQYCELYGHEVVETYADDGVSGTVPLRERPEGRRLLEDAQAKKFETLLVYRLDRLGRSLLVIVDAHDRLREGAGVALPLRPYQVRCVRLRLHRTHHHHAGQEVFVLRLCIQPGRGGRLYRPPPPCAACERAVAGRTRVG